MMSGGPGTQPKWVESSISEMVTSVIDPGNFPGQIHQYKLSFLADRTNGRAYATLFRLSVCLSSSVTLCIVAKRCVLEQKLLLRAYRKSYMRNRLVPK